MNKYSVPIIEETTYIYEVEARNGYEAAAKAALRHNSDTPTPDHKHLTNSSMGKILPTIEAPGRLAGAEALNSTPTSDA